jgi:predicted choloylglycine hydrolase
MYARNFDIGANVPAIVVLNQSKIGYRYIANTTYTFFTDPIPTTAGEIANVAKISGYVPLDGMNEKGLCVSMNNYQFSSSAPKYLNQNYPNRVDMTITILFKYLLQNASTVNEAIGLINQVNVHDNLQLSGNNNHIQIADRNHNSVIVEFNDDEQQSIRLIHPRANEKFLINENFTYDFPEAQ